MPTNSIRLRFSRPVSDYGEVLVVRDYSGTKVLCDPCNEDITVTVPTGRRAKLICYSISGLLNPHGRDHHVRVFKSKSGTGFACVQHPELRVLLQELTPGQQVDVLPETHSAPAYAVVVRPLPVLNGAATVQPVYAESAV